MSLLGSINDYYQNSSNTTALRALMGAGFFADVMPPTIESLPYCILAESNTALINEVKAQAARIIDVTVTFDVYGINRASVENILDLLEDAYIHEPLTITNRQWMATYFSNRMQSNIEGTDGDIWQGVLELTFRLARSLS